MIYENVQLERLVLGSLTQLPTDSERLVNCIDKIHTTCFTGFDRQQLFAIMVKAHVAGHGIHDHDLVIEITRFNPDLMHLLYECTGEAFAINSLESWIEELNALRLDREYFKILDETIKGYSIEADRGARRGLLCDISDRAMMIEDMGASSYLKTANEGMDELEKNGVEKLKTGIRDLDRFLQGGFDPGSLVVIGAAPSAGKTHFGLKLLLEMHKLQPGKEALVFTLEGKRTHANMRLLSHETGRLYKKMSKEEQKVARDNFRGSNILVSEKQDLDLIQITSMCKRAHLRGGVSVVMVDYLDRIKKPEGNLRSDEKLAEITNGLANLAILLNCTVILTTQLNKEAIKREDRRPQPVDSKNSNGAAEAASYWFGIKRIAQWDEGRVYPDSSLVELILGKNRNDDIQGVVWFKTEDSLYFDIDQEIAAELVETGNHDRKLKIKPLLMTLKEKGLANLASKQYSNNKEGY